MFGNSLEYLPIAWLKRYPSRTIQEVGRRFVKHSAYLPGGFDVLQSYVTKSTFKYFGRYRTRSDLHFSIRSGLCVVGLEVLGMYSAESNCFRAGTVLKNVRAGLHDCTDRRIVVVE